MAHHYFSDLAYLLRSLGLSIVPSLFQNRGQPEAAKPVFQKSFRKAVFGLHIHFIPMTAIMGLLYVNYGHVYVGPGFSAHGEYDTIYLGLYQLAAKLQEMLCVASLTVIVLQVLRYHVVEDGLPFGMLGAGLTFTQISFFWSPEFLAAAPFHVKRLKRFLFYIFLVIAGLTAALIGPSSAVLLLPRIQTIPAWKTSYYLNGTSEDFWPSIVNASSELEVCGFPNATSYAVCPNGGYESWRLTLDNFNYSNIEFSNGRSFHPLLTADKRSPSVDLFHTLLVQSPQSIVPPVISSVKLRAEQNETYVVHPHGATVTVLEQLVKMWTDIVLGSGSHMRWASEFITSTHSVSAASRVRCLPAQNLSANANQAAFPYLTHDGDATFWASQGILSDISDLSLNESSVLRAQWKSLPTDTFGIADLGLNLQGLLLELPWVYGTRVAVTCSISAAWHNGVVSSDSSADYTAWRMDWKPLLEALVHDPITSDQANTHITLDASWMDLLLSPGSTEPITGHEGWTPNALERVLFDHGFATLPADLRATEQSIWDPSNNTCIWAVRDSIQRLMDDETDVDVWNDSTCGKGIKTAFLEFVIASKVADGLSRYASSRVYTDTDMPLRYWNLQEIKINSHKLLKGHDAIELPYDPSFVVQQTELDVVGYAYWASATTDYLATLVVCAYLLMASAHIACVLRSRITSTSWETITELMVLCLNSQPQSAFKNTSAGIQHFETYANVVKVNVVSNMTASDEVNVESVVDEEPLHFKDEQINTDQAYR